MSLPVVAVVLAGCTCVVVVRSRLHVVDFRREAGGVFGWHCGGWAASYHIVLSGEVEGGFAGDVSR